MSRVKCGICPQDCVIEEGHIGFCRARRNVGGEVTADNYGLVTSMALDPIEKKPLYHFHPGSYILSVGSYGCNLRCPFCQNHEISMADKQRAGTEYVSPEQLIEYAEKLKPRGNIGIAFTYNEPLIGYEYVRDCAKLAKAQGLKVVLVSNGYVHEKPLKKLLPLIDAMNIDLKAFTEEFYNKLSGHLEPVKQAITIASKACHVEVTTLIVPGENDTPGEMRDLSAWLAGVDENIPLHISQFFPRYNMTDRNATPVGTVYLLADIAREKLKFVHEGNC
jgi:pyruvate formate lyase activating enzyme